MIENGVDTEAFKPREQKHELRRAFNLPEEGFLGLFAARPEIRKGIDVVNEIAGSLGKPHRIVAAVPTLSNDLDNTIQLAGLSPDEIACLYSACDYFLFPSRHEGCSIALLEALSSGLPAITTKVGSAASIGRNDTLLGEFILETYDPEVYLEKIQLLMTDGKLQAELGQRAREYVVKNNSLQVFKTKYLKLINDVVVSDVPNVASV